MADIVYKVYADRMVDTRMTHQTSENITIGYFRNEATAKKVAQEINKTHNLPEWFIKTMNNPRKGRMYWDYAGVIKIDIIDD